MLRTADLDYNLPEDLIATAPADPRDAARMMVVSRSDPALLEHHRVRDLPAMLHPGDLAVFNRTHVLRARLIGARLDTGGRIEGLFLSLAGEDRDGRRPSAWRVLLRSNGRLRAGVRIALAAQSEAHGDTVLTLRERQGEAWIVGIEPRPGAADVDLECVGRTPLPPYILRARRARGETAVDSDDRARYQTVFARSEREPSPGSVAAPTAGLHFTPDLLGRIDAVGVRRCEVELSVGYGTFAPVQTETVEAHPIHAEWCAAPGDVVHGMKSTAGRLIAVGTTTARTLESVPDPLDDWSDDGWSGWTRLLITPGYHWNRVDALLTNFHLPRSTLLAMVAALFPGGVDRLHDLYARAIAERYRFYSFGDAMLILP